MLKVITVDLDGIQSNLYWFQHWMIYDYYTKRGLPVPKISNFYGYDITEQYEIPESERKKIWIQYFPLYCTLLASYKECFKLMNYWQDEGRKVNIVTARAFATTPVLKYFVRSTYYIWRKYYDFKPDEVIWVPEKDSGIFKAKECVHLNSDLMIDDKAETNFDSLLDVVDVASLNCVWNIFYNYVNKPHNLFRANSWPELNEIVHMLDKQDPEEIRTWLTVRNPISIKEHNDIHNINTLEKFQTTRPDMLSAKEYFGTLIPENVKKLILK